VLAALFAASVLLSPASPPDSAYREALDLLYDGSTDTALTELARLAETYPHDPLADYFQALALSWKIEQRPDSTALDRDLHRRLDAILESTDRRLRTHPEDTRARLARGGAFGLRSRFHLFRLKGREAARAAQAMRAELAQIGDAAVEAHDAAFGLGLYDYYVDVLPRVAKLFRFLSGMPGGDRARGLAAIEEARAHATFHSVEATWQLYEIHAYYEEKPDEALTAIKSLHDQYAGAPLWALKLTEHLRERLGRYGEAAAVAREVLTAAERGEPNYGPVAAAHGRVALGEALLLDLRLAEARRVLLWFRGGFDESPHLAAQARLLLGRTLELEGDREAALVHYRAAAASAEKDVRLDGERALRRPIAEARVKATPLLAEARRFREGGRRAESVAAYRAVLAAWPDSAEARLRVAEDELRGGERRAAEEHLAALDDADEPAPPWVRPWSRLLRGYVCDLDGQREDAVQLYKQVLAAPYGDEVLARAARTRLRQPFRRDAPARDERRTP